MRTQSPNLHRYNYFPSYLQVTIYRRGVTTHLVSYFGCFLRSNDSFHSLPYKCLCLCVSFFSPSSHSPSLSSVTLSHSLSLCRFCFTELSKWILRRLPLRRPPPLPSAPSAWTTSPITVVVLSSNSVALTCFISVSKCLFPPTSPTFNIHFYFQLFLY